jgi:hypothetical protein
MPAHVERERKKKKLRKKHGEEPNLREKLGAFLKGSHNFRNMPELVKDQKRRTHRATLKERLQKQKDR